MQSLVPGNGGLSNPLHLWSISHKAFHACELIWVLQPSLWIRKMRSREGKGPQGHTAVSWGRARPVIQVSCSNPPILLRPLPCLSPQRNRVLPRRGTDSLDPSLLRLSDSWQIKSWSVTLWVISLFSKLLLKSRTVPDCQGLRGLWCYP